MVKTIPQKRTGRIVRFGLFAIFLTLFLFSGCKLYGIWRDYADADAVQDELLLYKPEVVVHIIASKEDGQEESEDNYKEPATVEQRSDNPTILQLQEKYHDVCGWVTIDGTNIDYCFAKAENNDKYLRNTLDGEYLVSGTVFLDYRCERDLAGVNSILYGHKMNNGTMFADLSKFADKDFFSENNTGTVYLPHDTYRLEIMAYLVVSGADNVIYNSNVSQTDFISYIRSNARLYNEMELTTDDTFLTLSTCNYEYDGARSVVVAKIVR